MRRSSLPQRLWINSSRAIRTASRWSTRPLCVPTNTPPAPKKACAQGEGLGRSRGGLSTKIHLRSNGMGLPVAVVLTGGEVSDVKGSPPNTG